MRRTVGVHVRFFGRHMRLAGLQPVMILRQTVGGTRSITECESGARRKHTNNVKSGEKPRRSQPYCPREMHKHPISDRPALKFGNDDIRRKSLWQNLPTRTRHHLRALGLSKPFEIFVGTGPFGSRWQSASWRDVLCVGFLTSISCSRFCLRLLR